MIAAFLLGIVLASIFIVVSILIYVYSSDDKESNNPCLQCPFIFDINHPRVMCIGCPLIEKNEQEDENNKTEKDEQR